MKTEGAREGRPKWHGPAPTSPPISSPPPVGEGWGWRGAPADCDLFLSHSVYRCGSAQGWSRRFRFRALKNGAHWSPRLAVFGDLGADNPKALPRLRRDTQQGMYDAVLHVGEASAGARRDGGGLAQGRCGARAGTVGGARRDGGGHAGRGRC